MPDIPCSALALWALAGADRRGRAAWAALAAVCAGACLLRPQGAVAAGALALTLWAEAGAWPACAFSLAAFAPLGLWLLRNRLATGTATHYLFTLGRFSPGVLPGGQAAHVGRLGATLLGEGLLGLVGLSFGALLVAAAAALALAGFGAARRLGRGREPVVFALCVYVLGLILLQAAWGLEYVRYLLPLLPALWVLLALGAREVLHARPRLAAGLAAVFAAAALFHDVRLLDAPAGRAKTLWPQTMAWIRRNVEQDARLQSPFYAPLMYFTGRQAIAGFGPLPRPEWLEACRQAGIRYEVVDLNSARWAAGAPGGAAAPPAESSLEVYRNETEGSVVYRIER